jgi:hypothetical protein
MKAWRRSSPIAAAVLAAACSPVLVNVPVTGPPPALRQLEGEWVGEYSGGPEGREGGLVFELATGEKVASGDVWMSSNPPGTRPYQGSASEAPAVTPLTIRFVWIEDDFVSGTLELYRDPETDHILLTTFRGRIDDGSIEGTFVTENKTTGQLTSGHWSAKRTRQPAARMP